MIIKEHGEQVVICDNCEEELGKYGTFEEAIEAISESHWKTICFNGTFYNYCTECAEIL